MQMSSCADVQALNTELRRHLEVKKNDLDTVKNEIDAQVRVIVQYELYSHTFLDVEEERFEFKD